MSISVGHVKFACQLYNFLPALGEEGEDTTTTIQQLNETILRYRDLSGMESLTTKKTKRIDGRATSDGASVGGASVADSSEHTVMR